MPSVPTLPSVVGGVYTTSQVSTLVTAVKFGQQRPRAKLSQRTLQTLTTATFTAIAFDAHILDTDIDGIAGHSDSVNNTRWTARYPGQYAISGTVTFNTSATGLRYAMLRVNGIDQEATLGSIPAHATLPAAVHTHPNTKLSLAAGDYVELVGYQNTGGNLDTYVASDYARSALDILWESI